MKTFKQIFREATNKIPDSAWAHIDIRFTPKTSKKDIDQMISGLVKKFPHISTKQLAFFDSYHVDPKNHYVQSYLGVVKDKYGHSLRESFSHGSSDAGFFLEKEIPVIVNRPRGGGHHGEDEWVDLQSLGRFYDILKEFVIKEGK